MARYKLSDFDYDLPKERIAQEPANPRDASRLLVYDRATRKIRHDRFRNIAEWLHPGTCLVRNNTRVEACRILLEEGRKVLLVLKEHAGGTATALVRPGRRFRPGDRVDAGGGRSMAVLAVNPDGTRRIRTEPELGDAVWDDLRRTPFPPYVKADESLSDRYQTVYSNEAGSKAAPTAGLHFTETLLERLWEKGFTRADVTLHVGTGTFSPVRDEELDRHTMHAEWYRVSQEAADSLSASTHRTAVGTTSMRVLETLTGKSCDSSEESSEAGDAPPIPGRFRFEPRTGETNLFITPGYPIRHTDSLITNFHLPKSTLLMLVAALTGVEELQRIYEEAIREAYRFYSFGDAMLIL